MTTNQADRVLYFHKEYGIVRLLLPNINEERVVQLTMNKGGYDLCIKNQFMLQE